jgi:hypothetical protein
MDTVHVEFSIPSEHLVGINVVAPRDAGDRSALEVRLLDDPPLLFHGMLSARPGAPAQAISDYGIFRGGGHLAPMWTPSCARQDIIGTPDPSRLCGQNQTLTEHLIDLETLLLVLKTERQTGNRSSW